MTPIPDSMQTAKQCVEDSQNQLKLYRQWFGSLVESMDHPLSLEVRYVVDGLLFWQDCLSKWERSVEYWTAREAVYPPPNGR